MTNLLTDSLDLPTFWFWNQMHCLNLSQVYFGHIWATLFCYRWKLLWMKHNCFYSAGKTYKNLEITILKEIWEVKQKYLVTINYFISKIEQIFHISLPSLLLSLNICPSFHINKIFMNNVLLLWQCSFK